jgi:hypothetical protein
VSEELAPFRISIYDASYAPQDWAGAPLEVHGIPRFNAPSLGSFVLDADDEQVPILTEPGTRCVLEYRYDPLNPNAWLYVVSGLVGERKGESGPEGTRTFEVLDDWQYVMSLIGVPNPAGDVDHQGDDGDYYILNGPAETVVKGHIAAAAAWHGIPITIAPDLGRGDTIRIKVRMHKLADRLFPAVTQAGIGVTVRQIDGELVVDCYEPTVHTEALTEASGVVVGGEFVAQPPTVTRVIVGGGGTGTSRVFKLVVNAPVEAEWGVRLPVFVDARDTTDPVVLTARAWEVLREGAPRVGVSAELAETDDFRFGVAVNVGDVVPIELEGMPEPVTDTVTEAPIDWTADGGLVVTPHVGEVTATFEELAAAALERIAARTRDQDARS